MPLHSVQSRTKGQLKHNLPPTFLASSFSVTLHQKEGLTEIAILEGQLRLGQLQDALENVQSALRSQAVILNFKSHPHKAHSKGVATRAQMKMKRLTAIISSSHSLYNISRKALLSLDLHSSLVNYPEMMDEDLRLETFQNYLKLGRGYASISWIWKVKGQVPSSMEEARTWETEGELLCIKCKLVN